MRKNLACLAALAATLIITACSSSASGLIEDFADAVQNNDTATCFRVYPHSRDFIEYVRKDFSVESDAKQESDYDDLYTLTVNGTNWWVDKKQMVIDRSKGLVDIENSIKENVSGDLLDNYSSFFEHLSEKEDRGIGWALNRIILPYRELWNLSDAIKKNDKAKVKELAPYLLPFLGKKLCPDFVAANPKQGDLSIDYMDTDYEVRSLNYKYNRFEACCKYDERTEMDLYGVIDSTVYEEAIAKLPIKVDMSEGYKLSDKTKCEMIKNLPTYMKMAKEYFDAVSSGNQKLADKLYPHGSFMTASTLKIKDLGTPTLLDDTYLYFSSGARFNFDCDFNGNIEIDFTKNLYDYSAYYKEYLAMPGATSLDLADEDDWTIHNKIKEGIAELENAAKADEEASLDRAGDDENYSEHLAGWVSQIAQDVPKYLDGSTYLKSISYDFNTNTVTMVLDFASSDAWTTAQVKDETPVFITEVGGDDFYALIQNCNAKVNVTVLGVNRRKLGSATTKASEL